jgi:hypothetical protein
LPAKVAAQNGKVLVLKIACLLVKTRHHKRVRLSWCPCRCLFKSQRLTFLAKKCGALLLDGLDKGHDNGLSRDDQRLVRMNVSSDVLEGSFFPSYIAFRAALMVL